jgi:hypothetical protein
VVIDLKRAGKEPIKYRHEFLVIQGQWQWQKQRCSDHRQSHPSVERFLEITGLYGLSHKNPQTRAKMIVLFFKCFICSPSTARKYSAALALRDADFGQNDAVELMQRFGLSRSNV